LAGGELARRLEQLRAVTGRVSSRLRAKGLLRALQSGRARQQKALTMQYARFPVVLQRAASVDSIVAAAVLTNRNRQRMLQGLEFLYSPER